LDACFAAGAAPARPGEFTERAFLNGKLDLLQAEGVADLIGASSRRSLRAANLATAGHFSTAIAGIRRGLESLRAHLEATIDFSDEASVKDDVAALHPAVTALQHSTAALLTDARRGARLAHGARIALLGPPNAGKSTLMNALCRQERAIVSAQPGTTRDVLVADVDLGGVMVTLTDTAGLHETQEPIEREGVRRAIAEAAHADVLLLLYTAGEHRPSLSRWVDSAAATDIPRVHVRNKIDLRDEPPGVGEFEGCPEVSLCARDGRGIDLLEATLRHVLSAGSDHDTDTPLLARARHLRALVSAHDMLDFTCADDFARDAVESAERLRLAHRALGELTGEYTSEDLLGEIFSRFCIGK
ncbi:MAG: tRNA modification GTPase, partial [Gammaproteobacteria bacterium]